MSRETGLLGLYWPARPAPLEACARRVYETFRTLQSLGYVPYYFKGRSRRAALKRPFEVTEENVLATLAKGVNHTDVPRRTIPDLGWSLSLWSGGSDGEAYSLAITCGGYSAYVGNNVTLSLPPAGPFSLGVSPQPALKAYEALVGIWQPEQAVLCEGPISWADGRLVPAREPLARYPPP